MTYASVPNTHKKNRGPAKSTQEWLPDWFFNFKFHHPVCHSGTPFDTFFFAKKIILKEVLFIIVQSRLLKLWGYPCILTSSAGFGRPIASEMTWMDDWYLDLDGAVFLLLANLFKARNLYRKNVSSQHAPNP